MIKQLKNFWEMEDYSISAILNLAESICLATFNKGAFKSGLSTFGILILLAGTFWELKSIYLKVAEVRN